jgi:hypothetical protein
MNHTIKSLREFLSQSRPCSVCSSPCIIHSTNEGTSYAEGIGSALPLLLDEITKLRDALGNASRLDCDEVGRAGCSCATCSAGRSLAASLERVP